MLTPIPQCEEATSAGPFLVLLISITVGVSFFAAHHDLDRSQRESSTSSADAAATLVSGGDVGRQLGILGLAALGFGLLVSGEGRRLPGQSTLAVVLAVYFAWCLLSVLWSGDPSLTVRRLGKFTCAVIGMCGVTRWLSARQLCGVALIVATAFVAIGLAVEFGLGTFRPSSADYRFSGTLHPNGQAPVCAVMALAAICLAWRGSQHRLGYIVLALIGVTLLVLTKSRTTAFGFVVTVWALSVFGGAPLTRLVVGAGLPWLVSCWLLGTMMFSTELGGGLEDVLLLGRSEDASSLTGRIPYWQALTPNIREAPFLGHGYRSFWTPDRAGDLAYRFQWPTTNAHSAYLDTWLGTGLIGLLLIVAVLVLGLAHAVRRLTAVGGPGEALIFAVLVLAACFAFLESASFNVDGVVWFVAGCGLVQLAYHAQTDGSPAHNQLSSRRGSPALRLRSGSVPRESI